MIELQDQKVMHDYFSELLFQPLVEELEKIEIPADTTPEENRKTDIELLPLPQSPKSSAFNQELNKGTDHTATVVETNTIGSETESVIANPWQHYQWENQRPPWAQERFDCLLFDVCGFKFAVPLITLGQIQAINNDLSSVFGQAPWFMGIQKTAMGKMRVVNTALFVMPERYKPDASYQPPYMISIADCPWALAVDRVNQPISLAPDEVKWRVHREKQTWLAGVVKKQMCVLIDIPALAQQLIQQDKNNKPKSPH